MRPRSPGSTLRLPEFGARLCETLRQSGHAQSDWRNQSSDDDEGDEPRRELPARVIDEGLENRPRADGANRAGEQGVGTSPGSGLRRAVHPSDDTGPPEPGWLAFSPRTRPRQCREVLRTSPLRRDSCIGLSPSLGWRCAWSAEARLRPIPELVQQGRRRAYGCSLGWWTAAARVTEREHPSSTRAETSRSGGHMPVCGGRNHRRRVGGTLVSTRRNVWRHGGAIDSRFPMDDFVLWDSDPLPRRISPRLPRGSEIDQANKRAIEAFNETSRNLTA